jgi:hypothetical protein
MNFQKMNFNTFNTFQGASQPVTIPREVDSAFNVTLTYRLDSDVSRRFGDIETAITASRFNEIGELVLNDDQYASQLMAKKFKQGSEFNTAWFVSNCGKTAGAVKDWFNESDSLIYLSIMISNFLRTLLHLMPRNFALIGFWSHKSAVN